MADQETISIFDRWAPSYDSSVANSSTYYGRYDEVLSFVAETAGTGPGRCILDIGTGTGNLAVLCASRGANVVGVDPSTGMLAQAETKAIDGMDITFAQVSDPFLRLPFQNQSFDAVVSTYAFHHVPNEMKPPSVREMLRVLMPGGLLAIGDLAFSDAESEAAALRNCDWLEVEPFIRVDELSQALRDCGTELHSRQFAPVTCVLWAVKR